jgi:hypothetical protein
MNLEVMKGGKRETYLRLVDGRGEYASFEQLGEEGWWRGALAEYNLHFMDTVFVLHGQSS